MESIIIETAKKIHSLGSEVDIIFQNKNKLVFPTQSQPKKGNKKRISDVLLDIFNDWDALSDYSAQTYNESSHKYFFILRQNNSFDDDHTKEMTKRRNKLLQSYKTLLEFLKNDYLEINIHKTNKSAKVMYRSLK